MPLGLLQHSSRPFWSAQSAAVGAIDDSTNATQGAAVGALYGCSQRHAGSSMSKGSCTSTAFPTLLQKELLLLRNFCTPSTKFVQTSCLVLRDCLRAREAQRSNCLLVRKQVGRARKGKTCCFSPAPNVFVASLTLCEATRAVRAKGRRRGTACRHQKCVLLLLAHRSLGLCVAKTQSASGQGLLARLRSSP